MTLLNTNITKHPLNWLVVWTMLLFAGFAFHLIYSYFSGKHPGSTGATSTAGPGTSANTSDPNAPPS